LWSALDEGDIIKGYKLIGDRCLRGRAERITFAGLIVYTVCIFLLFDEAHPKIVDLLLYSAKKNTG
jgi:hypothetical protein